MALLGVVWVCVRRGVAVRDGLVGCHSVGRGDNLV